MIALMALDGSALLAILRDEPRADDCRAALRAAERHLISAASLTELLVVSARRGIVEQTEQLLDVVRPDVVPLTGARARMAADAYRRWGKGFHRANLNLGDTFAYALAIEHDCPLLFVGDDFAATDVRPALA